MRVRPMELQHGDRIKDEAGEWEIVSAAVLSTDGRLVRVWMRKVGEPTVIRERRWRPHERLTVRRGDVDAV